MANYSGRLDDVLEKYEQHIRNHSRLNKKPELSAAEAKQAITSLIKELVEELQPDFDNMDNYNRSFLEAMFKAFEQNLLKALEEVK